MALTVKQMLDYSALTLLQTGDLSTTARRLTDLMETSGDFPAPFSNSLRVALDQIFVEEVSRGRIEGAFALALGVVPIGFEILTDLDGSILTDLDDQPLWGIAA